MSMGWEATAYGQRLCGVHAGMPEQHTYRGKSCIYCPTPTPLEQLEADMEHYELSAAMIPGRKADPLTKDIAFNRRSFKRNKRQSPYNNGLIQVGTDGLEVRLIQGIEESAMRTVLAVMENSTFGLTGFEVDEAMARAEAGSGDEGSEMFSGGLQGALDTQWIAFAVRGVSRACTHQLVRTSRAKFHQQSQRTVDFGERPEFRMPESVWAGPPAVFDAWLAALEAAHLAYSKAVAADVAYQDARYILPEGTATFITCAYSIREFMDVYSYRACPMFQWEISRVHRLMKEALVAEHPWMAEKVKISCERTKGSLDHVPHEQGDLATAHHCTFQGWEQVEGQCEFPWARESNRAFRSASKSVER